MKLDNQAQAGQCANGPAVCAKRKAQAEYDRKFRCGQAPFRTHTIIVGGHPVELTSGQAIASHSGWNRTRLRDWEEHLMIPPSIRISGMRFYTEHQAELMATLAELSTKRRPTTEQRAERDRFIRELWKQWLE